MVQYFKSGPRSSREVSGNRVQKAIERNRAKVAKRQLPSRGISLTELKNMGAFNKKESLAGSFKTL